MMEKPWCIFSTGWCCKVEDRTSYHIKVGEKVLSNAVKIEYYGKVNGPSIEECMAQVAEIAAMAIIRQHLSAGSPNATKD